MNFGASVIAERRASGQAVHIVGNGAKARRVKRPANDFASESDFQEWSYSEVKALGIFGWHTPNEGLFKPQYAAKRKRQGVMAGVADWVFIRRTLPTVAVELKQRPNTLSDAQAEFAERLRACGGLYYVAYAKQEFWQALRNSELATTAALKARGWTPAEIEGHKP